MDGFDDSIATTLAKKYANEINGVYEYYVKKSYRAGLKKKVSEFAGLLLTKKNRLQAIRG